MEKDAPIASWTPAKTGDVIEHDGMKYRVLGVSSDGRDISVAPIENTVDPEVVRRERETREAQEAEAREIMLEALRRTGS